MPHNNIVLSLGMGVDSTAILVRWLTDPSTRTFPLSALTVLVSQVGDEYPDTYAYTEQVILPMLRSRRVRLVQVARPALTTGGGPKYVVLDDSAAPHRLVRAGPVRLSQELACNGTVAQVSNRRCSLRWKGEVLDAWIADHVAPGHIHVLGFAADEQRRIDRDRGIIRHGRRPSYPLASWGWTRAEAREFLYTRTGVRWNRSACAHCPFQAATRSRAEWVARWAQYPALAASALVLEQTALALNPRMKMFGAHTAWDLATAEGLLEPVFLAGQRLAVTRWCLYEVRRTFTGPNRAMRSVRIRATGSRAEMQAALPASVQPDEHGIRRMWLSPPAEGYPRVEHLLVAAPAGVDPKQRKGFETLWDALSGDDGLGCDPGP